jgi:hypothetical protein
LTAGSFDAVPGIGVTVGRDVGDGAGVDVGEGIGVGDGEGVGVGVGDGLGVGVGEGVGEANKDDQIVSIEFLRGSGPNRASPYTLEAANRTTAMRRTARVFAFAFFAAGFRPPLGPEGAAGLWCD